MLTNAYLSIYELLSNAIFGGTPEISNYGVFFCEGISVLACAFLVFLPFLIVWRLIKRFI